MAGSGGFEKRFVFTLWILTIFTFTNAEIHRLNVPRALLPIFHDFPVNFTLEVTVGGCYHWSTSRPDIIRLIPVNEQYDQTCSSSVVVQTVTREASRSTAIVLAEDTNGGQVLRCDVIVDAIATLNMVTTTRELFIEEAPEAFEVRAYDEQGNEFTSLAGIEFTWSISNTYKQGVHGSSDLTDSVLRFLTFEESPYETPNTVAMLDKIGKVGNIVLMEGVKTGTAKISVQLMHSDYKHVLPVEVELVVIANLIIIPVNVTVMEHDSFKYKVMQVHHGRLEEIKLPSNQYYLKAEIQEVLEINNEKGSAYALMQGRTKVLLHDKNVNEDYDVILPTAEVCISEVSYISIAVMPHRSRTLILGQTHEIVIELYNSKDHKFYIGDNVDGEIKLEMQYFDKIMATKNGTHSVVVPTNIGVTFVEATLYGITDQRGRKIPLLEKLTAKTELTIHSQVQVQPRTLALPWDPKAKFRSDVALKATGGDGSYVWNSRYPSVVTVSQNGVVKVFQSGSADVSVSMTRNPHNRDLTKIHVLPPTKLEISQYNMEAAVGERINLHIALFGRMADDAMKEIAFNDCRNLPFEVYIPERNFAFNASDTSQPSVGIACTTLVIVAQSVGTAVVTVAYNANGQYLMDNVTVSAYDPLVAVHPVNGQTVLAVGSSRKIVFKGGPHPWSGKLQGYHRKATTENEEIVQVSEHNLTDNLEEMSVFEVICIALGESIVRFTVSNIPILPNCNRKDAVASVQVICAKPRYIYLQPEFKDASNCPLSQNADRMMARSGETLQLAVVVKDEDGKRFDNITSLNIEWSLKPSTGGAVQMPLGVLEETFTDHQVVLPLNHYQRVQPSANVDSLLLRGKVTGYQKAAMARLKISPEWPAFPVENDKGFPTTPLIKASLKIFFVEDTIISPSILKVLNDPNNKYELLVSQGSGFVELEFSNTDVADVRYIEPAKTISVVPKKPGVLHLGLVDLCLAPNEPAVAVIEVQQLASLEVVTLTKVEVGKCVKASVRLYDTNGYLITLPSPRSVNVTPELENSFVEINPDDAQFNEEGPYGHLRFLIHGVEEGETQLVFRSNDHANHQVESESIIIQVFQPLKVIPKNLTALVGTSYQIRVSGGPKNAEIEFSTDDTDAQILSIDGNGILEGKAVGKTRIIARAVGFDSRGEKVVYSQDDAVVHVTVLEGVKIVVPTSRIKVNAVIPVWAFGVSEHLTPLLIGSMKTPMVFSWSTDRPDVLGLGNMYEGTGINMRNQNEVALRGKALKPGLATVFLNVTIPCHVSLGCKYEKSFSASTKVDVFEELRLVVEDDYTALPVILMAPNSVLKLNTNLDKLGGVTSYKTLPNGHFAELDNDSQALTSVTKSVTVDKNGIAKSGETLGKTVISITHVETYGFKQTLTAVIEVKPVHYMMLHLKTRIRLRSGEELNMLPKGMELKYVMEYFDIVGSKFHAANINVNVMYNRGDLISLSHEDGNSLSVKFIHDGDLVVKIYNNKYPMMFDYAHMLIGDVLFPAKTYITVGDIVCFSMPLLSSDGSPGYWKSSVPEVLTVDPVTGIGKARHPGHTHVEQSLTSHLQGELQINVEPIAVISLVMLEDQNITGMEVFSVPVVLKGKDEKIKDNNILSRSLGGCRTVTSFSLSSYPFTCVIQFASRTTSVSIKDLFLSKPRFDIVSGLYFCDIIPIGSPTVTSSILETSLKISAVSKDIESNFIEVAYLPPVFISTKEIVFLASPANTVSTATLEIHGLPQVLKQITIEAPEEITVGEHGSWNNVAKYKLSLMRHHTEVQGQKITVTNDLTKQNISLLIRASEFENCSNLSPIPWLEHLYLYRYAIGTLFVLLVSLVSYWKMKVVSIDCTISNRSVFADKSMTEKFPPPMKKSPAPCTPSNTMNTTMSTPGSLGSPIKPFSTFEPVYGDPRGFYTPNARRNRSFQ